MIPINVRTQAKINALVKKPTQAAVLIGPSGSGTYALALFIRDKIFESLGINAKANDSSSKVIEKSASKSIGIAEMLELEKFLYLKVPIRKQINRIVIIKDAHLLTIEAQNALLKTLEEPPLGTMILLASESQKALLPTVQSRLQTIFIDRPETDILVSYFKSQGHDAKEIENAVKISGGLPELADSILNDGQHPMIPATEVVRDLLSKTLFERLCMVDLLSKDRELCINMMNIFHQMAHLSLLSAKSKHAAWQKILTKSVSARDALEQNSQPKIVLSDFLLSI